MFEVKLSTYDRELLEGKAGKAAQLAMEILVEMAQIQKAKELTDITHVHIGGSIYTGEYSLKVIESLRDFGGKVTVPTTMNAISIDRKRWREYEVDPTFANNADRLASAFENMGVETIFSCTPYIFPNGPKFGNDIVWAESNAIAYANSVIGARTNRHGDFLDICAAITGRAPKAGFHLDENRLGTFLVKVPKVSKKDTTFYTVLGYLIGKITKKGVPVIDGLDGNPTVEHLKAFSAAISTSGPVGLYHLVGITPEAKTLEMAFQGKVPDFVYEITLEELAKVWEQLSTDESSKLDLVVLGSPHFTLNECKELATLVKEKHKNTHVDFLITTSTYVFEQAKEAGYVQEIERFGARFSTDICLCMLNEAMIGNHNQHVMTNSGKFAHYGPGLINRNVSFGSLEDCVESAVHGKKVKRNPFV